MRKDEIIQKIDELANDLGKPDLKKTEALIAETLKFFEYVREKLQSPDPEDRKAALEEIQEVQKKLDDLAKRALNTAGMSPEELSQFMANSKNFSPNDWDKIKQIRGDITSYSHHIKHKPIKP